MKKLLFIAAIITLFSSTYTNAQDVKTQSRNIGAFNTITTTKGINVTLIEGDKEKIEIEIENAAVTDVITEIKGRDLKVKLKNKIYKDVAVQVYVSYKTINQINAESGSFITSDDVVKADLLTVKAGSGASIVLDVDVRTLKASSVSSKIELVGEVDFQEVSVVTGGKYIADKLISREAIIKTGTGGVAWVNTTEDLDMKTTTGGKIIYNGNPAKIKSKGNIQKDSE